ncbi:MAG: alkaline phosphatase family protein [Pirellulales bacterium]
MKRPGILACTLLLAVALSLVVPCGDLARAGEPAAGRATDNVILLMTDGLRWQEVFNGAEESLMTEEPGGVKNVDALKQAFWHDTPEERREALMPFLWTVVAKQGQIFGNQAKGSKVQVTNGMNFSYPGYNETLCGYADPRIDSNDKKLNPNITVFEWLHRKPRFRGKSAAFAAWDCFPFIFNHERCGFLINAGYDPLIVSRPNPRVELLNRLRVETTQYFPDEPFDSIVIHTALEYVKDHKPRLLFLSLGETDTWGHAGRYDHYLASAHRADACFKELWETLQSMPEYRGKTSVIFTVDHGRGDAPVDWKSHGRDIARSEFIWLAALGPDTKALGERENVPLVTQSQVAATLAALVGEDFCSAVPQAARPIAGVLAQPE